MPDTAESFLADLEKKKAAPSDTAESFMSDVYGTVPEARAAIPSPAIMAGATRPVAHPGVPTNADGSPAGTDWTTGANQDPTAPGSDFAPEDRSWLSAASAKDRPTDIAGPMLRADEARTRPARQAAADAEFYSRPEERFFGTPVRAATDALVEGAVTFNEGLDDLGRGAQNLLKNAVGRDSFLSNPKANPLASRADTPRDPRLAEIRGRADRYRAEESARNPVFRDLTGVLTPIAKMGGHLASGMVAGPKFFSLLTALQNPDDPGRAFAEAELFMRFQGALGQAMGGVDPTKARQLWATAGSTWLAGVASGQDPIEALGPTAMFTAHAGMRPGPSRMRESGAGGRVMEPGAHAEAHAGPVEAAKAQLDRLAADPTIAALAPDFALENAKAKAREEQGGFSEFGRLPRSEAPPEPRAPKDDPLAPGQGTLALEPADPTMPLPFDATPQVASPSAIEPSKPAVPAEVQTRSVLDAAAKAGIPGAKEAIENIESMPESTARFDEATQRWTRDPVEAPIEGAFAPAPTRPGATGEATAPSEKPREWDSPRGRRRVIGEATVDGEPRLVVETEGVGSRELIKPSEIDRQVQIDTQPRRQAPKAEEPRPLDAFTEGQSPIARGKARDALDRQMSNDGKVKSRRQIVDEYVDAGARVVTRPDGTRRLVKPDGGFLTEKDLGKTAFAYAESKTGGAPKKKAPGQHPEAINLRGQQAKLVGVTPDGRALYEGANATTGEPIHFSRDKGGKVAAEAYPKKMLGEIEAAKAEPVEAGPVAKKPASKKQVSDAFTELADNYRDDIDHALGIWNESVIGRDGRTIRNSTGRDRTGGEGLGKSSKQSFMDWLFSDAKSDPRNLGPKTARDLASPFDDVASPDLVRRPDWIEKINRLRDAARPYLGESVEPSPVEAPKPSTYIGGDRAEYTGTKNADGFHEVVFTEGPRKGKAGVTSRGPDGSDPYVERNRAERADQQAQFARLNEKPVTARRKVFEERQRKKKAKDVEGMSPAEFVRSEGGIDLVRETETGGMVGETNRLRLKESGTTGMVDVKGGRGKTWDEMHRAMVEAGAFPEESTLSEFVEAVHSDTGPMKGKKSASEAKKNDLGYTSADEQRWIDAGRPSLEREPESDLAGEDVGDTSFDPASFGEGDPVVITKTDGTTVEGTFRGDTDRRIVVDTPETTVRIRKSEVDGLEQGEKPEDPPGAYLGSEPRPQREKGATTIPSAIAETVAAGASALGRAARPTLDWVLQRTAPRISRADPKAGAIAGGLVGSSTTAGAVAPVWGENVFGKKPAPELLKRAGHANVEWQFRARRERLEADIAKESDPDRLVELQDALDAVGTIVGAKDSPFKTESEMDAYFESPEFKDYSEKWRAEWNKERIVENDLVPGPERMFRDLVKKGEHDPDLVSDDPRDLLRVNMRALKDGEEGGTEVVGRESSPGNLGAPRLNGHAFAREFKGTGDRYETDPYKQIEHTFRSVHEEWLKPQLYDALVASGNAVRSNSKASPPKEIKGEPAKWIETKPRKVIVTDGKVVNVPAEGIYVRESHFTEIRQMLKTDARVKQNVAARVLNTLQLTGIADNVWNVALDTLLPGSAPGHIPGRAGLQAGLANNVWSLFKQARYTIRRPSNFNERRLDLSADGAWRGASAPEWTPEYARARLAEFLTPKGYLKEIGGLKIGIDALGRFSARVHEAGRLALDDAFSNLVKIGFVKDTPVNRREFINRMGQYAGRGMGRWTQGLRDSGIQPFMVAKKKSAGEILRKVSFSPGVKATSAGKAVELRVGQFMRLFSLAAAVGITNLVRTGSFGGRPGTPFGNIDSGESDEKGRPISSSILADLTGWGAAARGSGVGPAVDMMRTGGTTGQTVDVASRGMLNAFVLKWLSTPTVDFVSRAASGQTVPQALGGGGGPKAEPPLGDESKFENNVKFAVRQSGQLFPLGTQVADKMLGTSLTPETAPDAGDEAFNLLHAFAPKKGTKPSIVEALPAIRSREQMDKWLEYAQSVKNKMTDEKWRAWVLDTTDDPGVPPAERYRALVALKIAPKLRRRR